MESVDDETDREFEALVEAMKRSPRPLALLGAGTSMDSGYPSWKKLLQDLKKSAKVGPKHESFLDSLNDPAWQAEEYSGLLGEVSFNRFIEETFGPKKPKQPVGATHEAIVRLRFRHILTTNYDPCIEDACDAADVRFEAVQWTHDARMRKFFRELSYDGASTHIVYLHGRYDDPENVILTESSYARRYVRSDDAPLKLLAIMMTQSVVFIGFSVTDPDLNHIMRGVNARLGAGDRQHFALIGYRLADQRDLIRRRFEGKFGIRPVFYQTFVNSDGEEDHSNLLRLLDRLYARVHGRPGERRRSLSLSLETPPAPAARQEAAAGAQGPAAAAHTATDEAPIPADPLDQQKGRWGGQAEANGRRIRVENVEAVENLWCEFDLVIEPTDAAEKPLAGVVEFHLHQTFKPKDVQPKEVENGQARLQLTAYGAFTVGAVADGRATQLELDLAQVEAFPSWFRDR